MNIINFNRKTNIYAGNISGDGGLKVIEKSLTFKPLKKSQIMISKMKKIRRLKNVYANYP